MKGANMNSMISMEDTYSKFFTSSKNGKVTSSVRVDMGVSGSPGRVLESEYWNQIAGSLESSMENTDKAFSGKAIGKYGEQLRWVAFPRTACCPT